MDEDYGAKKHPEIEKDFYKYEPQPVFTMILEFEKHENMINTYYHIEDL